MYEFDRITDPEALIKTATRKHPTGPAFDIKDAQRAAVLIVEATTAADPGPDLTRWTLIDATGALIARADVPGF
ncbi:hypothetical protein FHW79_006486 [Azospirillum sp. OGB3]|uniref:hypothetical protein n=1 Tax=Azospirillum sp. OGB3 TaxID=2587012 RepID=UPI0016059986|nr:hypothetical protein [Azospirillum sp. OGB3]MBB3268810.1 hypothetical protein [Azospirillum sp. OGB3]